MAGSRASNGPKRLLFVCVAALLSAVLLELGVRAVFALRVGPSVLLYGIRSPQAEEVTLSVETPDLKQGSYTKFKPHQIRVDRAHATGELFQVTINGRGFRGEDPVVPKPEGVLRIVTLGASSTFGYHSREHETYPQQLEDLLNTNGERFEVVNLGIPHSTSSDLVALFKAEALPLEPDVVTLYSGINDMHDRLNPPAVKAPVAAPPPWWRSALRWAKERVLVLKLVKDFVFPMGYGDQAPSDVERHRIGKSEQFLQNVSTVHEACRERGILFVVATQQAKSMLLRDGEALSGLTYAEEVEVVREKLAELGLISSRERDLLTHNQLMNDLRVWARENSVPLVDVIAALDAERDVLLSWVHLSPRGNRLIAEAFAETLRRELP